MQSERELIRWLQNKGYILVRKEKQTHGKLLRFEGQDHVNKIKVDVMISH